MADLIRKARPRRKARYVCMEGADKLVRLLSVRSMTLWERFADYFSPTASTAHLSSSIGLWIQIEA